MMDYSIYIHIPFCQRRCNYCDFVTYAGMEQYLPPYIDALIKEFRIVTRNAFKFPVHTIFFGGGTPSLVPVKFYDRILNALSNYFVISNDCEISIETNPGTLSGNFLKGLKALGFNRLSLGVQSMQPSDLQRLERIHSVAEIYTSISAARRAGFNNINLDLMFALPWQSLANWENTLRKAIVLQPEHFSLYSLLIEPSTKLFNWYQKGLVALQDQDKEGAMYEFSINCLRESGYRHYEISNWSKNNQKSDYRCQHNLQYWRYQPYLGFGAGAHGYAHKSRTANVTGIFDYCDRITAGARHEIAFPQSPATKTLISLEISSQMKEFMMLGLRLVDEGVSNDKFFSLFGYSLRDVFGKEISRLIKNGLVEFGGEDPSILRLTKRGVLLGNQVFMAFI